MSNSVDTGEYLSRPTCYRRLRFNFSNHILSIRPLPLLTLSSAPHPSEPKIHLRIQMYDNQSAISCLFSALASLRELYSSIQEAYEASLKDDNYVKEDDVDIRAEVAAIREEGDQKRQAIAEERATKRSGAGAGADVEMA